MNIPEQVELRFADFQDLDSIFTGTRKIGSAIQIFVNCGLSDFRIDGASEYIVRVDEHGVEFKLNFVDLRHEFNSSSARAIVVLHCAEQQLQPNHEWKTGEISIIGIDNERKYEIVWREKQLDVMRMLSKILK